MATACEVCSVPMVTCIDCASEYALVPPSVLEALEQVVVEARRTDCPCMFISKTHESTCPNEGLYKALRKLDGARLAPFASEPPDTGDLTHF